MASCAGCASRTSSAPSRDVALSRGVSVDDPELDDLTALWTELRLENAQLESRAGQVGMLTQALSDIGGSSFAASGDAPGVGHERSPLRAADALAADLAPVAGASLSMPPPPPPIALGAAPSAAAGKRGRSESSPHQLVMGALHTPRRQCSDASRSDTASHQPRGRDALLALISAEREKGARLRKEIEANLQHVAALQRRNAELRAELEALRRAQAAQAAGGQRQSGARDEPEYIDV